MWHTWLLNHRHTLWAAGPAAMFSLVVPPHTKCPVSVSRIGTKSTLSPSLGNVCVGTLIATSVISPLSLPSSWAFGKVRGCYWLGMEVYLKGTGFIYSDNGNSWSVIDVLRLTSLLPFLILMFVSNHMYYWGEVCDVLSNSKLSYTNIYCRWPIRLWPMPRSNSDFMGYLIIISLNQPDCIKLH